MMSYGLRSGARIALIGALALESACAARSGGAFVPGQGPAFSEPASAGAAAAQTGRLAIRLPVIVPSSFVPVPNGTGLSSATNAVSVTFGKAKFGPLALTIPSGRCNDVAAGLACSFTVDVPPGTNTVSFTTYRVRAGHKIELAVGSMKHVLVRAGRATTLAPSTWFGIAKSIGVTVSPKSLTQAGSASIVAYGIDAGGGKIPTPHAYSPGYGQLQLAIRLSGPYNASFGALPPPTTETFGFDGKRSGTERVTVTATSGNLPPGRSTFSLTATLGPIVAALADQSIVEFAAGANGNVAPLRTFPSAWGCWGSLSAPETDGNFWIPCTSGGATHVRNAGQAIGTIPPTFGYTISAIAFDGSKNQFLAEIVGSSTLGTANCSQTGYEPMIVETSPHGAILRQLILPNSCIASMAVDAKDNVYVALYNETDTTTKIVEYGATVSGYNPPPTRSISFAAGANAGLYGFACDTAGNVFAELNGNSIIEIPTTGTSYTTVLNGPSTFSLDAHNDIWAEIPGTGAFSIEEFAPGSPTPMLTIAGTLTGLTAPGHGIVYAAGP